MVGPGDGREVGVADGVDVGVHRVHVVRHVAAGMMGHAWVSQPTHTEVTGAKAEDSPLESEPGKLGRIPRDDVDLHAPLSHTIIARTHHTEASYELQQKQGCSSDAMGT